MFPKGHLQLNGSQDFLVQPALVASWAQVDSPREMVFSQDSVIQRCSTAVEVHRERERE